MSGGAGQRRGKKVSSGKVEEELANRKKKRGSHRKVEETGGG